MNTTEGGGRRPPRLIIAESGGRENAPGSQRCGFSGSCLTHRCLTSGLAVRHPSGRAGRSETRCFQGRGVEGRYARWLSKPRPPERLGNIISGKRWSELTHRGTRTLDSDKPVQQPRGLRESLADSAGRYFLGALERQKPDPYL